MDSITMGSWDEVKKAWRSLFSGNVWMEEEFLNISKWFQRLTPDWITEKRKSHETKSTRFFQSKRCHSKARIHQTAEASQIGVSPDSDLKLSTLGTFSAWLYSFLTCRKHKNVENACIQRHCMTAANQHVYYIVLDATAWGWDNIYRSRVSSFFSCCHCFQRNRTQLYPQGTAQVFCHLPVAGL